MKKALVIGGKGKVGTYLVPMLAEDGYEVVNVSRSLSAPFLQDPCWKHVRQLTLDRQSPEFPRRIAAEEADVIVDMICFTPAQMDLLLDAAEGHVGHYLACGSAWIHGTAAAVPCAEFESLDPPDDYGKGKLGMVRDLALRFARTGFPGTMVHPGHITGPGHVPIGVQGHKGLASFRTVIDGKKTILPDQGVGTLHHVHAEDVAGVFLAAIRAGSVAYGQDFHAVSPAAVTLRGYAEAAYRWFGHEPALDCLPFPEWARTVTPDEAALTLEHVSRAPSYSMEKARRLLGFTPRHTSLQALKESWLWLAEHGKV